MGAMDDPDNCNDADFARSDARGTGSISGGTVVVPWDTVGGSGDLLICGSICLCNGVWDDVASAGEVVF